MEIESKSKRKINVLVFPKKNDVELPTLCKPTIAAAITFKEKMTFPTLLTLCKSLGSNVYVIENQTSLQQALEVTKHIEDMDCNADKGSALGRFHKPNY